MSDLQRFFYFLLFIDAENKDKPQPHYFQIFRVRPRLVLLLIVNYFAFWFNFNGGLYYNIGISLLYITIVALTLSDFGEIVIRRLEDIRHLATNTEKDDLTYLLENVKERGEEYSKMIDYTLNLYIIDTPSINACCIGKHTIAITRGMKETMSPAEIEGLIAHETGHIINGDGQVSLLVSLASSVYIWGISLFIKVLQFLQTMLGDNSFFGSLVGFIKNVIEIALNWFMTALVVSVSSTSRKEEYRADKIAFELGYGEELLSALYKLYDMEISDKKNLMEQLKATHPKTAFRIEALEKMLEEENTEAVA